MENIANSINKVIQQLEEKQKDKRIKIYSSWQDIVGKLLAKHSSPADLRNKVLVVNVENSAWMYMLRLKQGQILENIKNIAKGEDVRDIKLRIGKIS